MGSQLDLDRAPGAAPGVIAFGAQRWQAVYACNTSRPTLGKSPGVHRVMQAVQTSQKGAGHSSLNYAAACLVPPGAKSFIMRASARGRVGQQAAPEEHRHSCKENRSSGAPRGARYCRSPWEATDVTAQRKLSIQG